MHFCWLSFWSERLESFDLEKEEFLISRDVVFYEDEFPMETSPVSSMSPSISSLTLASVDEDWLIEPITSSNEKGSSDVVAVPTDDTALTSVSEEDPIVISSDVAPTSITDSSTTEHVAATTKSPPEPVPVTIESPIVQHEAFGRGQRPRHPPAKLNDYVAHTAV